MAGVAREYFDRLYAADPDPWGFESRWYERRKYDLTLAALPDERYRSGFEPGCSVGVLSERLAERCDRLLVCDHMPVAIERAASRFRSRPQVRVERLRIPEGWPDETFDLIVLSEVVYYFDQDDAEQIRELTLRSALPGATVVAVHWRGETDYPLTGDETHELLGRDAALVPVARHLERDFRIDVWRRAP